MSDQSPIERRTAAVWLASGFGFGYSPLASGTVGALWGLPLAWALGHLSPLVATPIIIALCIVGVPLCTAAAKDLGGKKDPGTIVFDEIASMPITFFLVPMHGFWVVLVGFLLNRLIDITKPPPARQFERLPDGLGIMADDWMAGIYSCGILHLLVWLDCFPSLSG